VSIVGGNSNHDVFFIEGGGECAVLVAIHQEYYGHMKMWFCDTKVIKLAEESNPKHSGAAPCQVGFFLVFFQFPYIPMKKM